tara:strand:+ start:1960 stop:3240 length:1281 start_codon:yes stop_codon:yes gene_type:complete
MSLNKLTFFIGIIISLLSSICFFIYRSYEIIDFVNLFLLTNFVIGLTIIFLKKIRFIIFVNYFFSIIVIYSINFFLYFNDIRKIENGTILTQIYETEKERINNKNIWPSITPSYLLNKNKLEIYPLGTFINRNIILCEEDKRIDIKTDKYGFNNFNEVYKFKKPNIILGDSYGFGGCVSHENDFSYILNSLGIKNINLSISGSSIIVQTAIFLEYVKNNIDYNEVYLFLSLENDIPESRNEANSYYNAYTQEYFVVQKLIKKENEINKFYEKQIENLKNYSFNLSSLRQLIFLINLRKYFGLISSNKEFADRSGIMDNYYNPNLFKLNQIVGKDKLTVIIIPSRHETLRLKNHKIFLNERKNLIQFLTNKNIKYIDLMNIFNQKNHDENRNLYTLNGNGHFNKNGHSKIASFLFQRLSSKKSTKLN